MSDGKFDVRTELTLNGRATSVDADPKTPLLYILRNDCRLNGPKFGCGLGECGACTVLIDGLTARACIVPLAAVRGRKIVTLEGLSSDGELHPVQQAFIDEQGTQCGYCLNGMIMTVTALLEHRPDATEADIRWALRYNLCRCGAHIEIMNAALRAAELVRARQDA